MKDKNHSEGMLHITLSSSILENLAVDYIEKTTHKKVSEYMWIQDDDYGFAGFRVYFEDVEEK